MSIFEYDQEAHMKHLKKEYYADGWEDGREEGVALTLISLIQNWIKRGFKDEEIVNLTEEPQERILRLIQIIKENPEMDNEQIRKVW
ncbi:MAG: hypothetical protein HDQ99_10330 [Lachnospiraceae bacterium]|nr:hypothetical protein [Lachnospiraceae bacterium]